METEHKSGLRPVNYAFEQAAVPSPAVDLADKGKIIDLWKRKRQQIKHKNRRNTFRRFTFILCFLLINGGLIYLAYILSSPFVEDAIRIKGLYQLKEKDILSNLNIKDEKFWLLKLQESQIIQNIKKANPLIVGVNLKSILLPGQPRLEIHIKEDLPWARFSNGWMLTSSARVIRIDKLNFNNLSFASQVLLLCDDNDYKFWSRQGKTLQKLIYSVSSQLPEMHLKGIKLSQNQPILLYFQDLEISLGIWDDEILNRSSRLASTNPIIKKYQGQLKSLDLSDDSKAIMRLNDSFKETKK